MARPPKHSNSKPKPAPKRFGFWAVLVLGVCSSLLGYFYLTSPSPSPVPESLATSSPMFEVVDLPGRGKGVMALRDIKQGELVIREKPILIIPRTLTGKGFNPATYVSERLLALDPDARSALYNLSYVHFPPDLDPLAHPAEVAVAIISTNAVATGDAVGVFPTMARLNHGCAGAFNAVYSWREKEGVIVVHALKDIAKGQELLTTYTDTKRPRDERREYLLSQYDFGCTCSVCSLPAAESRLSDERLSRMAGLYGRLATWSSRRISGSEAISCVRQIWALGTEEGYWSERGQLAADAAHVASAHSDGRAAREWATVAMEWFGYELGADDDRVGGMRQIVAQPEDARGVWGSRDRENVGGPM